MFSVFFEERCSLALRFIYWLADNTLPWNLKNSLKFSQSQFTNWVLRNALVLLCIATPCRAKVSKSQIQKKEKCHWLLFYYAPISIRNSETLIFWKHLSFLVALLELTVPLSIADACSAQRGMKTESPEEMIWNCRKCYFLSLPCATTSPHLYLFYIQQNLSLLVQAKEKTQFALLQTVY